MKPVAQTEVQNLVAQFRSGGLSRREFFQKLAFATGSILLAQQLMLDYGFASEMEIYDWPDPFRGPQDAPPPTPKESIAAGEKRLPAPVAAESVEYPSGDVKVGAYLAKPKAGAPFAAIIVIHENRGVTEFVLDIAQRWALEGLLAVAPDCLSRLGGTAKYDSMDAARTGIGQLDRAGVIADLQATLAYLKTRKDVKASKIGVSGFCWGGANTFNLTVESKELAFAVPFYGAMRALDKVEQINCPVFAVYAESDQGVNANLDELEAKMKELKKNYTRRVFPGTQHAFMNFTNPQRYNAGQAKIAWSEVTAFVKKTVG